MTPAVRRLIPALAGSVLVAAACSAPSARIHAGYIQTTLDGSASLTTGAAGVRASARADVDSGLGLTEDSGSLYLRGELDAGPVRLTASAMRYDQAGRGRLDVDFGDISAGTAVDSDVTMGVAKVALTFDILDFGAFRLSPGIGADVIDLDATVTEVSTQFSEQIDELLPMPMLFVQAEAEFGPVGVIIDVGGMDATFDEFSGTVFDVEALATIEPVDHLELFAGYRWISIDADGQSGSDEFATDLTLGGWFVGGGVKF